MKQKMRENEDSKRRGGGRHTVRNVDGDVPLSVRSFDEEYDDSNSNKQKQNGVRLQRTGQQERDNRSITPKKRLEREILVLRAVKLKAGLHAITPNRREPARPPPRAPQEGHHQPRHHPTCPPETKPEHEQLCTTGWTGFESPPSTNFCGQDNKSTPVPVS